VSPQLGYVALLCALPVFILFCIFGKWENGIGAWVGTAIVFMAAGVRWDLRRRLWFWIIISFALLLQTPFVLLVPWNDRKMTWVSLLPVGVLDYFFVYSCVKLGERLMKASAERGRS
jgi:hypothetical protein